MMTQNGKSAGSNTAFAVAELRELVFSGALPAGSDHLESELADRLNMSRTPVREALLRLETQGLVEVRPRKGVRITPIAPNDMAEVYDILTELESLAAAKAAAREPKETDLQAMAQAIADMQAALERNDRESWAAADTVFHTELVRLSGNRRIADIVKMLSDQVRRARRHTLYMRPAPVQSNADHLRVLEAIRKGDSKTARLVHHQHRLAAKDMLVDLLVRHRLSSI